MNLICHISHGLIYFNLTCPPFWISRAHYRRLPACPHSCWEHRTCALNCAPFAPYALVLHGVLGRLPTAIGGRSWGSTIGEKATDLSDFGSLRAIGNMMRKHVVAANGGAFDLYVHSWQPFLKDEYRTHVHAGYCHVETRFQNNTIFARTFGGDPRSWGQTSFSIGLSAAAMMVLQDVGMRRGGQSHERVLFVRTDLALVRDIDFGSPFTVYDEGVVYNECCLPSKRFPNGFGDQLLLTNGAPGLNVIARFYVRNAVAHERKQEIVVHHWMQKRLDEAQLRFVQMDIISGWDCNPIRMLGEKRLCLHAVGAPFYIHEYGMTMPEAARLGLPPTQIVSWSKRNQLYAPYSRLHFTCRDACFKHPNSSLSLSGNMTEMAASCFCTHNENRPWATYPKSTCDGA